MSLTVFPTAGGPLTVHFAGIPGSSYQVQCKTNLADAAWVPVWVTNAPAAGLFDYVDAAPPAPTAFYRLLIP